MSPGVLDVAGARLREVLDQHSRRLVVAGVVGCSSDSCRRTERD